MYLIENEKLLRLRLKPVSKRFFKTIERRFNEGDIWESCDRI